MIKEALLCLALNIYYESRGEPLIGQIAVAHVTQNRVEKNKSNICAEVFKPNQFSWTRRRFKIPEENDSSWKRALEVAKTFRQTIDPTNRFSLFFE